MDPAYTGPLQAGIRLPPKQNAPNSFESWDVRRTALPRSLLTTTLTFRPAAGNGSNGLLWDPRKDWAVIVRKDPRQPNLKPGEKRDGRAL